MKQIELGDVVKDRITGYSGVAIARTDWMHNCPRFMVQARETKDGKPVVSVMFDEPDLEFVEKSGIKIIPTSRPKVPLNLGDVARDRITGLEGVVIAWTVWLNGCTRCNIKPRELKDGVPVESSCIDEQDLVLIQAANPKPKKVTKTGGPRPAPSPF